MKNLYILTAAIALFLSTSALRAETFTRGITVWSTDCKTPIDERNILEQNESLSLLLGRDDTVQIRTPQGHCLLEVWLEKEYAIARRESRRNIPPNMRVTWGNAAMLLSSELREYWLSRTDIPLIRFANQIILAVRRQIDAAHFYGYCERNLFDLESRKAHKFLYEGGLRPYLVTLTRECIIVRNR